MTAVTPSYYEGQSEAIDYRFEIRGDRFTNLPSDAIAYLSDRNNNPEHFFREYPSRYVELSVIDNQNAIATGVAQYAIPVYLGVICSRDRQTIYWVNETRPLPT